MSGTPLLSPCCGCVGRSDNAGQLAGGKHSPSDTAPCPRSHATGWCVLIGTVQYTFSVHQGWMNKKCISCYVSGKDSALLTCFCSQSDDLYVEVWFNLRWCGMSQKGLHICCMTSLWKRVNQLEYNIKPVISGQKFQACKKQVSPQNAGPSRKVVL